MIVYQIIVEKVFKEWICIKIGEEVYIFVLYHLSLDW